MKNLQKDYCFLLLIHNFSINRFPSLALIGQGLIIRSFLSVDYFDCMIMISKDDVKCINLITKDINSIRSVYRLFLAQ
jgi:hypothetical protein